MFLMIVTLLELCSDKRIISLKIQWNLVTKNDYELTKFAISREEKIYEYAHLD